MKVLSSLLALIDFDLFPTSMLMAVVLQFYILLSCILTLNDAFGGGGDMVRVLLYKTKRTVKHYSKRWRKQRTFRCMKVNNSSCRLCGLGMNWILVLLMLLTRSLSWQLTN